MHIFHARRYTLFVPGFIHFMNYINTISSNIKYVFPNASCANILKPPSGMRGSSNIPVYIPPELASPIVKLVNQIST